MKCKKCNYILKPGYVFCPWCGASQVEVRLVVPEQVFLATEFACKVEVFGDLPVRLEQVLFSGEDLEFKPKKLARDNKFNLKIDSIPGFCDYHLEFRFKGNPTLRRKITVINAASLEFTVQNLYNIKPFAKDSRTDCTLSFSVYDEFALRLHTTEKWALDSKYYIAHNKKSIQAERRDNTLIWKSDALIELLDDNSKWQDTKYNGHLGIITQDDQRLWAKIEIEFNQVPKFELLNEQEIIAKNRFLVDNPDKQMNEIVAKIGISNVPVAGFESQSTNFKSFKVRFDEPYLHVDGRPRYQNEKDCQVKFRLIPKQITDSIREEIQRKRQFEFHLNLDIEPSKGFGNTLCRKFKLAIPAITGVEQSEFAVIDFGTTNSCMLDDNGNLIASDMGGDEHNTLIHFEKFRDTVVDSECTFNIDLTESSGLTVASNFKSMLIGKANQVYTFKDNYGDFKSLTPRELTHIYLKHLTNKLVQKSGKKPQEIILTYPAIFSKQNRDDLFGEVRKLGYQIKEENCVSEPEAIAFYYLNENETIRAKALAERRVIIAVLDCGGGTSDYSVVEYYYSNNQPEINVIASWGSNQFAGTYLTFAYAKCGSDADDYPDTFSDVYEHTDKSKTYREKFNYLELEKIKFSEEMDPSSLLDDVIELLQKRNQDPGDYANVFINYRKAAEIDNASIRTIEDQFLQIQDVLKLLYDEGETDAPSVDYLVLAGNSCRMPLFKFYAEKHFPGIVIYDPQTIKTAVAKGAHIYRSNADNVVFRGLRRSKESFVISGHLGRVDSVFRQWLNMDKDNLYASNWYPAVQTRPVVIFKLREEDKNSLTQKVRAFELKIPELDFKEIKFELNYRDFRIIQRWVWVDQEGNTQETEWQTVYSQE